MPPKNADASPSWRERIRTELAFQRECMEECGFILGSPPRQRSPVGRDAAAATERGSPRVHRRTAGATARQPPQSSVSAARRRGGSPRADPNQPRRGRVAQTAEISERMAAFKGGAAAASNHDRTSWVVIARQ